MKKRMIFLMLIIFIFSQYAPIVLAEDISDNDSDDTVYGTGLAEMSDVQWNEFNSTLPLIIDVKPNEIALSRLETSNQMEDQSSINLYNDIIPQAFGQEVSYAYPDQANMGGGAISEFPLTSAVDVSKSLTFPPIGDQGEINSCVAWSLCYYQLTNNNCVAKGINAKTPDGDPINENIMSPRFTYTLINGGRNTNTYYNEACAAIMSYGCPNVSKYSAVISTSNLDEWSTDYDVWYNAIYNKPQRISYGNLNSIEPVTADTQMVINIKRLLSNGYVVTIPTYVNSFNYTNQTTNGDYGCRYMSNSKLGAHAMTIVGYDDDFWVDINNNNNKDNGEIGAFKVANSWGTSVSNYTNGYVWLAYDAVGDNSSVANAPTDRAGAFDYYYFIEPEIDYMPLLIANVRMKSKRRNQIAVKVGLSNIDSTTPDELISVVNNYNIAFNNASEGFVSNDINVLDRNFSGGKILQAITIPFDLTPVIKKEYAKKGLSKNADIRLYIEVTDANNNGFDVKLGKVEIIEPMTGKKVECLNENTLAANNNSVMKTVDFQVTPFIGFDENQDITLTFNSNIQENTVANNIYLAKNNTLIYPEYDVISNKIIIYPPDTGYINDTNYEIHINDELISMGGNTMESDKTILLYILDDYYVFE